MRRIAVALLAAMACLGGACHRTLSPAEAAAKAAEREAAAPWRTETPAEAAAEARSQPPPNPLLGLWISKGSGCAEEFTADTYAELCSGSANRTTSRVTYALNGAEIQVQGSGGSDSANFRVSDGNSASRLTSNSAGGAGDLTRCGRGSLEACAEVAR